MDEEHGSHPTLAARERPRKLTPALHRLASIGEKTKQVVEERFAVDAASDEAAFAPLLKWDEKLVADLADALGSPWTDDAAATFLIELHGLLQDGTDVDGRAMTRWVRAHPNDPDLVIDCATVLPPDGFSILAAMSKTGSQKRVYLARWKQVHAEVVLKRLLGNIAEQEVIWGRELQSHPLAMRHPNIIATHPVTNPNGDKFLVEEKLAVLNDRWRASGIHEAANLLHDIARALAYLHDELRLVHGDVKPDNIGQKGGAYILLDFGICREESKFTPDATATGSLRTRAPELFSGGSYPSKPGKVDVWALGATVYKAVAGRFPFVDEGEEVPRVSSPKERAAFQEIVAKRISDEWATRVATGDVPEPLRGVLERVLQRDPQQRLSARELVELCEQKLAGFLSADGGGGVSAETELDQILRHIPRGEPLRRMPAATRQQLAERVRQLRELPRVIRDRQIEVDALLTLLE